MLQLAHTHTHTQGWGLGRRVMRGVRGRRIAKPAVIDISEREQMDEELEREGERESTALPCPITHKNT